MNILILEDDILWQSRLQMMLQSPNIANIKIVGLLSEARILLSEFNPNLVIADVVLPDGISYDLFKNIKRDYPIIFVTGYPNDDHLKKVLSLDKTAFIVKPFHSLSLEGIIQMLLPKQNETKEERGLLVSGRFRKKILLPYENILYLEADSNYVHIYTNGRNYIIKRSLRMIMFDLDQRFVQVHKAFVINKDYIDRPDFVNQQILVYGKAIPVGRSFKKNVISLFN